MSSPFVWRNVALLAVCAIACGLAVRMASPERWTSAAARAGAVAIASAALLIGCVAVALFAMTEIDGGARACWTRAARWSEVRGGLSETEVAAILGPPISHEEVFGAKRWLYRLHPFGDPHEGAVEFSPVDGKVREKWPGLVRSEWIVPRYRGEAANLCFVIASLALIAVALTGLFPWPLSRGLASWPVYLPAAALTFTLAIRSVDPSRGGWGISLVTAGLAVCWILILPPWLMRLRR